MKRNSIVKSFKREKTIAALLLVPSSVLIGIFVYGFIIWTARLSVSNWKGIKADWTFVGLKNYYWVFDSLRFKISVVNNILFIIFFVAICIVMGFVLAVLLDRKIRGENIFRSIFIYPLSVSFVASGVIWRWIFSPNSGINNLLNTILAKIGIENLSIDYGWFITVEKVGLFNLALIPIIIAASWQYVGYIMAMFLAALRGMPEELREAARVEGATEFRIYKSIILPLLKPVTLGAMIILGHISLKLFDLVYIMTGSGPAFVTDFLSIFMFETTFRSNNFSQGAAIAIIILFMVMVLIIPYIINSVRKESEI